MEPSDSFNRRNERQPALSIELINFNRFFAIYLQSILTNVKQHCRLSGCEECDVGGEKFIRSFFNGDAGVEDEDEGDGACFGDDVRE